MKPPYIGKIKGTQKNLVTIKEHSHATTTHGRWMVIEFFWSPMDSLDRQQPKATEKN